MSDWQVDDQGRKFRYVGTCKEYQPTFRTTTSGSAGVSSHEYEILEKKNEEIEQKNRKISGTKGCYYYE